MADEILSGDGITPPPVLTEEQQKAADQKIVDDAAVAQAEETRRNGLTQEQRDVEDLAKQAAKTPEQIATEAEEAKKKTNAAQATADQLAADLEFFDEVNKMHGIAVPVEYGAIDPMSAQGVYLRDQALQSTAITDFEKKLEQADPRGYAYLLHRQAGGNDEDFFSMKTLSLPEYDTFKDSVDLQTRVFKSSLIAKGVPEKQAQMVVDDAVKSKEIFELADKAYKDEQASQKKYIDDMDKELKNQQDNYKRQLTQMSNVITKAISATDLSIIIPEADKPSFEKFIKDNVHFDNSTGTFLLAQRLTPDEMKGVIESAFLAFKKGDLGKMVKREAGTQVANRMRKTIEKPMITPTTVTERKANLPLGSL